MSRAWLDLDWLHFCDKWDYIIINHLLKCPHINFKPSRPTYLIYMNKFINTNTMKNIYPNRCIYSTAYITGKHQQNAVNRRFCFGAVVYLFYVFQERKDKYYYHCGKTKDPARSSNYLCMILDGMDQNKLLVPSLMTQTKACGSSWRLKTHLKGTVWF